MTEREALKLALEALSPWTSEDANHTEQYAAYHAIREALAEQPAQPKGCQCPACKIAPHKSDCPVHNEPAWPNGPCDCGAQPEQEPEFMAHKEGENGWSDWVCPDPKSYLMKCCDCGLVHEAQFGVVRYASEAEKEKCDMVEDPNLQAVFRMRRSEQWSPVDTAHRAGGLPMEQPAQEPVAVVSGYYGGQCVILPIDPARIFNSNTPLYTTPPQRKPLTDEEIVLIVADCASSHQHTDIHFARAIEAAHGINAPTERKGEA